MRDFLVAHADLPWGAKLWTFGSPRHADGDGWTAERGTLGLLPGALAINPDRAVATIASPPDQVIRPARIDRLVLRFAEGVTPVRVDVSARTGPDAAWHPVGTAAGATDLPLAWPAAWRDGRTIVEQIKVELAFAPDTAQARLQRVLLYPK